MTGKLHFWHLIAPNILDGDGSWEGSGGGSGGSTGG